VEQDRVTRAFDAHGHRERGVPVHDSGDRLDELLHGRRSARSLPGGTAAQLVTARQLVKRVVQSASH
jgi:hypothetical protein